MVWYGIVVDAQPYASTCIIHSTMPRQIVSVSLIGLCVIHILHYCNMQQMRYYITLYYIIDTQCNTDLTLLFDKLKSE